MTAPLVTVVVPVPSLNQGVFLDHALASIFQQQVPMEIIVLVIKLIRNLQEAIQTVRKYHGRIPLKWWLAQPHAVWFKSPMHAIR